MMTPIVLCIPKIKDERLISYFNKDFRKIFEIDYKLGKIYKIIQLQNKDKTNRYIIFCELKTDNQYFKTIKNRFDNNCDIKLYYNESKFLFWKISKAFFQPSYSQFSKIKKEYNFAN